MKAIISVAVGRRNVMQDANLTPYENSVPRLNATYKKFGGAKVIVYRTLPPDCPPHEEVPYAMKPYAVQDAVNRGFDQVIWTDCSVYPVAPMNYIWDILGDRGYFFMADEHLVGEFTADSALPLLDATRDELLAMPMMTCAFFGLDFRKSLAQDFLTAWLALAQNGAFKGPRTNKFGEASRHPRVFGHLFEQTAASVVANRLGMKLEDAAEWGLQMPWNDTPPRPGPLRLQY